MTKHQYLVLLLFGLLSVNGLRAQNNDRNWEKLKDKLKEKHIKILKQTEIKYGAYSGAQKALQKTKVGQSKRPKWVVCSKT